MWGDGDAAPSLESGCPEIVRRFVAPNQTSVTGVAFPEVAEFSDYQLDGSFLVSYVPLTGHGPRQLRAQLFELETSDPGEYPAYHVCIAGFVGLPVHFWFDGFRLSLMQEDLPAAFELGLLED